MLPWFVWDIYPPVITIAGFIISVHAFVVLKEDFCISRRNQILMLFLVVMVLSSMANLSFFGVIDRILKIVVVSIVLCLRIDRKIEVFDRITTWTAALIGLSFVFYCIHFIGINLPHVSIEYVDGRYTLSNYFIFLFKEGLNVPRFQSVFMEPGHMAMGLVPLLVANEFNLKDWRVWSLFLAILSSFSLAAFVVSVCGIVVISLSSLRGRKSSRLLLVAGVIGCLLSVSSTREGILDEMVFSRLKVRDGGVSGYNRYSSDVDTYFSKFSVSSKTWFGVGPKEYIAMDFDSASGFKVYWICFGLVGVVGVILFYLSQWCMRKKHELLGYSFVFLLLLSQNGYPMWYALLFAYLLGGERLCQKLSGGGLYRPSLIK